MNLDFFKQVAKSFGFGAALFFFFTSGAFAGESVPWSGPLTQILNMMTGTWVVTIATIICAGAFIGLGFGILKLDSMFAKVIFTIVVGCTGACAAAKLIQLIGLSATGALIH